MKRLLSSSAALLGSVFIAGCSADYADVDTTDFLAESEQAVAACEGDDLQYDFNAFAASLAVAAANELKRWDATSDFRVNNGKLALTSVGLARCNGACPNVAALLQLQEDATSVVPNHSPFEYRSRLVSWYNAQVAKLQEEALASKLRPGRYRIKNRYSGDFIAADNASSASGAVVEMWDFSSANADQWDVSLESGKHKFKNVKTGLCLSLLTDSSANGVLIGQKTCASTDSQRFNVNLVAPSYSQLLTRYNKALGLENWGTSNETKVTQYDAFAYNQDQHLQFIPVNGSVPPTVPKSLYTLTVAHTGKKIAMVGNLEENAPIRQMSYPNGDDHNNWYITPIGSKYQLVNRTSSKCMALQTDSATAPLVQQTCSSSAATQQFTIQPIQNQPYFGIISKHGRALEVQNYRYEDNTPLVQANSSGTSDGNRQFTLTPIFGGEPHKLAFSHTTDDAACGKYYWYTITQPNGLALNQPQETYLQLIFAGGKQTLTGTDINPFIAQQSSGTLFAIDPSGYMNLGNEASSGSCIATDLLYDPSRASDGKCCVKYTGSNGILRASSWNPSTFLCQ